MLRRYYQQWIIQRICNTWLWEVNQVRNIPNWNSYLYHWSWNTLTTLRCLPYTIYQLTHKGLLWHCRGIIVYLPFFAVMRSYVQHGYILLQERGIILCYLCPVLNIFQTFSLNSPRCPTVAHPFQQGYCRVSKHAYCHRHRPQVVPCWLDLTSI